ncbi:hypothetical protein D0S45_08830 [Marinifilum sp. JC120]|nr:hypothetical protein D0S45_08830 [Marinifilum sp. JC120]
MINRLAFFAFFFCLFAFTFVETSRAEWIPDVPTKLGTNITAIAQDATDGLVAVGDDGKAYHMAADKMKSPTATDVAWTQVFPPASTNFVGVAHDGEKFWAVTNNGTIVNSADGVGWSVQSIDDADARTAIDTAGAGTEFEGKAVVGIACPEDGGAPHDVVIVTTDGAIIKYDSDAADAKWSSISFFKSEAVAKKNNIRGVKALPGSAETFMIFGAAEDKREASLYRITSSGTAYFYITNCLSINDLCIGSSPTSWYVVGDNGKVVKGTLDLTLSGTENAAAIVPSGGTNPNLYAIDYDFTNGFGYAVGAGGEVFHVIDETVTYKHSSASRESLRGVSLVTSGTLRRAFVVGDDGTSFYGGETFWTPVLSGESKAVRTAPDDPKVVGRLASFYCVVNGGDNRPYFATAPTDSWFTGDSSPADADVVAGNSATGYASGKGYLAAQVSPATYGRVGIWCLSGGFVMVTPPDEVTSPSSAEFLATLKDGETTNLYFTGTAANKDVQFIDIATTGVGREATSAQAARTVPGTVSGLAASSKGLYIIEADTVKAMAAAASTATWTTVPDTNNVWTEVNSLNGVVGTAAKLFQTSDNKVVVVNDRDSIFIIDDSDATEISLAGAKPLDCPATDPVVSVSGSSTDLTVATATDVWRYTPAAGWEKYGSLSEEISVMNNISGIVSKGAGVLAIDADTTSTNRGIAYSSGPEFTIAAPATQPDVGNTINTIYNATKSVVYVGGDNGLLYKGVYNSGSFSWTRISEGSIGSKTVNRLTGFGDQVVALINDGKDLALFDGTNWDVKDVSGLAGAPLTDISAINDTTIYATSVNAPYLYKFTYDGTTFTPTEQGKAGGDGTLTALNALDVSAGGQTIYAVGSGEYAFKLSDPVGDNWTVSNVYVTSRTTGLVPKSDVFILSDDSVWIVGDKGYVAEYDGRMTNLHGYNNQLFASTLNSIWAYGTHVYVADSKGQVHEYNTETKSWTSTTVETGKDLKAVTGSVKGKFLVTAGQDGIFARTTICASGGETETDVCPGSGEDADLVVQASSVTVTPAALKSTYNTPEMTVVGDKKSFKSKPIAADATHNFNFTVTPVSDVEVNTLELYKLYASTSSSKPYTRVNAVPSAPTDGVFWVTDQANRIKISGETLNANTVYTVNFGIKDNGDYDTNPAPGVIEDPLVLGSGSGSGSTGCTFNPAQDFSLEWMLVLFIPLITLIRQRAQRI